MASMSFLLITALVGFAMTAVAAISLQFGRHSRAFTYSLVLGVLLGGISLGAQLLLEQTVSDDDEESSIFPLLKGR